MSLDYDWKMYAKQLEERNEILEYQNQLFIKATIFLYCFLTVLFLITQFL